MSASLALLGVIFLCVPALIYSQLREADSERQAILLRHAQIEGRLIAESLRPLLSEVSLGSQPVLAARLRALVGEATRVRLLLRPSGEGVAGRFYFVSAMPPLGNATLHQEPQRLSEIGVTGRLSETCAGGAPLAERYVAPDGEDRIVTSVTAVNNPTGCWVVVTEHVLSAVGALPLTRPYWQAPEIQFAAAIYVVMVVIVITVFMGVARGLRRFSRLAREIRVGGFADQNFARDHGLREVAEVAAELDRLVASLEGSARAIREAAEENAHALKTPIAVIAQSVEPLKRLVPNQNERGRRAVEMIEHSVERLNTLIPTIQRLDEMVAELMDPARQPVDLSALLNDVVDGWSDVLAGRGVVVQRRINGRAVVESSPDHLETIIENLLDNAVRFSPPGGTLRVGLRVSGKTAEMTLEDQGPGVPPADLDRIFERYYSPTGGPSTSGKDDDSVNGNDDEAHLGIGLWIVRRNAESMGGRARAENLPGGGFRVTVSFPVAG